MIPQSRPATIRDGLLVAKNLRKEDREELEGMDLNPRHLPFGVVASDHTIAFFSKEGVIAGVAGVVTVEKGIGQIWMLCTEESHKEPIRMVRSAKRWIKEIESNYRLLWNLADARNHVHHKLLKHLGFRALREVPVGSKQLPYYEVVRLCA